MNKLPVYLLTFGMLSLFGFSSCTDLDEKVYSSITENSYPYSPGDATKAVGAIYANLRGMYTPANRTQEISSDEIIMPANMVGGWDDGGVYRRMHLHQWNSEQTLILDLWKNQYAGVLLANRALSQLNNQEIPLAASENASRLMAEIRALRAYHYWIILDNWNNAPLLTEPTDELPANATRQQLFDFVTTEIKAVLNDLPLEKSEDTYGRFTQGAAHALLANVYLNAEVYTGTPMWKECIEACDAVFNSGQYQLDADYRTPFSAHNENSLENIWVIPYDEIYGKGFEYYRDALHKANKDTYNLEATPSGTGSYKGVPQFIATYDPDDDRLSATWLSGPQLKANGEPCMGFTDLSNKPLVFENKMPNGIQTGEGEGLRWLKYEIEQGAKSSLNNDFVVFRLAQIYMMKAEALLRSGQADQAAELVTTVRQRAFKDHPEKAKVTGAQLQEPSAYVYGTVSDYVLSPQNKPLPASFGRFYDELGWEFAGELMRRRDMIRFGTYTQAQWLSHEGSHPYRSVFPIPQRVLDSNNKLAQNPDYIQ